MHLLRGLTHLLFHMLGFQRDAIKEVVYAFYLLGEDLELSMSVSRIDQGETSQQR